MTITLELSADVEASLTAQAQSRGLDLDFYVESLLKEHALMGHPEPVMSAEQFEAELDALAARSARIPLLPLEALSRDGIYQDHDLMAAHTERQGL
jgi:hypothetical protein